MMMVMMVVVMMMDDDDNDDDYNDDGDDDCDVDDYDDDGDDDDGDDDDGDDYDYEQAMQPRHTTVHELVPSTCRSLWYCRSTCALFVVTPGQSVCEDLSLRLLVRLLRPSR